MPGGERVPFLFTTKNLIAKGDGDTIKPGFVFKGDFTVPSYRTGLFLDPKGRGATTGYDYGVGLAGLQNGSQEDKLFKESNKTFDVFKGEAEFKVTQVDNDKGEMSGVFISK